MLQCSAESKMLYFVSYESEVLRVNNIAFDVQIYCNEWLDSLINGLKMSFSPKLSLIRGMLCCTFMRGRIRKWKKYDIGRTLSFPPLKQLRIEVTSCSILLV